MSENENKCPKCSKTKFIILGTHQIEVSISRGIRMVKHSDTKGLLGLKDEEMFDYFVDAKVITNTLFKKIYKDKTATKEQSIVFSGLCVVGLYSLIDEVCKIDLRGISYIKEFNDLLKNSINKKELNGRMTDNDKRRENEASGSGKR